MFCYLKVGKLSTLTASVVAILTAIIASNYSNLMDYLQTLFSMFNAPLFAIFIIGMFWKRATPHAGWIFPGFGTNPSGPFQESAGRGSRTAWRRSPCLQATAIPSQVIVRATMGFSQIGRAHV